MPLAPHLPALAVVLPLLAAAVSAATRGRHAAWAITSVTFWVGFGIAVMLATGQETISYAFGGHLPPVGIAYTLDGLSRYMLLVVTFIAAVMIPYAGGSLKDELAAEKHPLFYALLLLFYGGLLGIALSGDMFNIYVFVEISSLALYVLTGLGKPRQSLVAAFEYLVLGTIGATFFLIGIYFLYSMTGTLNIADMAQRLPEVAETTPVAAGVAFILLGLFLKFAAFPLHRWLINVYANAPSFIAAFAAACGTKLMLYLLIRMAYTLFGATFSFDTMHLGSMLLALGIAGIVAGTFFAIQQQNVRRMLAYSSVAQVGYILLGIGLASEPGLAASLTHMANHALAKGALFLAAGCVLFRTGGVQRKHFSGMGKQMPWTMAAFMLAGLSLLGVPGTAGFISKWLLLSALLEQGQWLLLLLVLASSVAAAVYLWKVAEAAYFGKPSGDVAEAPLLLLLPLWALALANVWFGFATTWTAGFARQAAAQLMAGG